MATRILNRTEEDAKLLKSMVSGQAAVISANNIVQYNEEAEHADFNKACEEFRKVSKEIEEYLGLESFTGGFTEIEPYLEDPRLDTEIGRHLERRLNYWNSICIHEGNKIGLPPPQWFFKCWGIER